MRVPELELELEFEFNAIAELELELLNSTAPLVPRREAQGQILTTATQRRDGLCVCICDAPRGTWLFLSGSMIIRSIPRRLRGPTRADSI